MSDFFQDNSYSIGKIIVVILPDSGERYLSTVLFEGIFGGVEGAGASDVPLQVSVRSNDGAL